MYTQPRFVEQGALVGASRLEIYGAPFGAHKDSSILVGYPVGSNIPAGLFVVYSPDYASGMFGDCAERTFMLPDVTGGRLLHNDRVTTFADSIEQALDANGLFRFVGVSADALHVCKDDCEVPMCCPFGYADNSPQHGNYWPRLRPAMNVVTAGMVNVYNETDIPLHTDIRVRIKQAEGAPCQYLGAVTTATDDGTQALGSNIRIDKPAKAGDGVWIQLGGMALV